jgi:hypothetical protein
LVMAFAQAKSAKSVWKHPKPHPEKYFVHCLMLVLVA